jgi:hypothetical protein
VRDGAGVGQRAFGLRVVEKVEIAAWVGVSSGFDFGKV